ncbi:XTP/dITP diphosphatase [Limosilactobacillus fastidiosus]|uniref:dITP/XTP pyrophosphatase n=1 Tax=Limosilactobacillus fastidiosus TaxID=2759855 RepID=A0A7W3TYJ4_9LACO|nr:XTP/dITP diphosphatase [Limosilactobacillus fastidiosus]MBB1063099.1 XTP/dITP diphosphatase [Limosilactobacillus fastidiosus]MBB1085648.1 XTP/dITP diphosphatase [Limosilactobacillus fastidiosus]MCD7083820.1 XTP/dITP diphosphatase [Limosilactobacillus fastidiosus]MCD7086127.1 XTP/dITP diphosphatase [Limosilactobacillus fastidiosus]MCD7113988.1 XTP/dITP diphosphatase [Limosilactobacillus fastidiosus]
MDTLVIATKNQGKAREYREMLAPYKIDVKTLADFSQPIEINENGTSFLENATIKAKTVMKKLGIPVMADDSGLMVDALNGAPGVHSARYAGDHNDQANNAKLLRDLSGVVTEQRTAHFHTTIVALKPDGAKLVANGQVDGRILTSPRGKNGFGYDPLFYVEQFGSSMAELTAEQKNSISHRGQALGEFMKHFAEWWNK